MPSCAVLIRTDLAPSYPPGGVWTYVGYSSINDKEILELPANGLVEYPEDYSMVFAGDNFTLDTGGKTPGFYFFSYTLGGTVTIQIMDEGACYGSSITQSYAASDATSYNARSLISSVCAVPETDGVWVDLDDCPALGFVTGPAGAASFVPSQAGEGTWRFRYQAFEEDFDFDFCTNCQNKYALFTAVVSSGLSGNIVKSASTCSYSMDIRHPDTDAANQCKVTVAADAENVVTSWKKRVINCEGTIVDATESTPNWIATVSIRTTSALTSGGYIETLTLANSEGGTVTVPLAPSGANQATFSGVGGSTNATALTFNPLNTAGFTQALTIAIDNYLADEGFTAWENYNLNNIVVSGNQVEFFFGCKHNPTDAWLGVDSSVLTYKVSAAASAITLSSEVVTAFGGNMTASYSNSPCPTGAVQLLFIDATVAVPIDTDNTAYNSIALIGPSVNVSASASSNLAETCSGTLLTPVISGCAGTLSYLWGGGQTSSTLTVAGNGTYSLSVTCSSPSDNILISAVVP